MARINITKTRQLGIPDEAVQQYAQSKGVNLYDSSVQAQPQQPQEGFQFSSLLPLLGAIGGSFTPLGPIGGGALGAGAGKLAQQFFEKKPVDIGEIGKESLLTAGGGAIGGKILGPLLGKLGGAGTRAATIAPKSTIGSFTGQEALTKVVAKFPELTGTGMNKFQNVQNVINKLTGRVDDLLGGVSETIPTSNLVNQAQTIASTMDPNDARNFLRLFNREIRNTFGDKIPISLNAQQVNQLRRGFNRHASSAFGAIERGGQLSAPNQAILELRDLTDDYIVQLAPQNVKGAVDALNQDISTLLKGIPEFKQLSEQGVNIFGIRPPMAGILPGLFQTLQNRAGKGLGGIAPLTERIGLGAGAIAGGGTGEQQPAPIEGEIMPSLGVQGGEIQPNRQENIRQAFLAAMLANPKQTNTLKTIFDFGYPESTKKAGAADEFLNKAQQTISVIKKKTTRGYGPIEGRLYETEFRLAGGAGAPKEVVELNQLYTILKLNILRAYQGARISDKDFELAQLYIPNLSDTEQVARTKVQVLEDLLATTTPQTESAQSSIPIPEGFGF